MTYPYNWLVAFLLIIYIRIVRRYLYANPNESLIELPTIMITDYSVPGVFLSLTKGAVLKHPFSPDPNSWKLRWPRAAVVNSRNHGKRLVLLVMVMNDDGEGHWSRIKMVN